MFQVIGRGLVAFVRTQKLCQVIMSESKAGINVECALELAGGGLRISRILQGEAKRIVRRE